jgi:hypothetical protein
MWSHMDAASDPLSAAIAARQMVEQLIGRARFEGVGT